MASKPRQPALYELMGTPQAERVQPPRERPSTAEPGRISAGRAVRVPAGYLWLGGGLVVLLLVGVFSLGYVRGHDEARRVAEQDWLAVNEPRLPVPPPEISAPADTMEPPASPLPEATSRPPSPEPAAGWGPIGSDPRVAGLNYFVLIHTQRANAERLAAFCREHGVEAYAIEAKNGSLYRVIALPGYARGERSSAVVRRLEQRIKDVQRDWKLQVNPRDDLAYYPERFDG